MTRSRAATLQDIAREVGVATMTVSVVLNGARSATRVSDATRARIKEAAERLSYQPNAVARGLTRRRMDTIGVVALVRGGNVNLYFLEVIGSIIDAAKEHRQNTTIFSIDEWGKDHGRLLEFCDGRVDGMILVSPTEFSESVATSLVKRLPVVMLHNDAMRLNMDNVDVDDEGGAHAMTEYLISLGHRRIAHFAGLTNRYGAMLRLAGYKRALEEAAIAFDPSLVTHGEYGTFTGRRLAEEMLAGVLPKDLPTAIFCATDAIAAGCMEVLSRNGVRIPDDISVTGYDGLLQSLMTVPALTTIQQPLSGMGRYAVERIMRRINEGARRLPAKHAASTIAGVPTSVHAAEHEAGLKIEAPHTETFDCKLVIRSSAGPPRST